MLYGMRMPTHITPTFITEVLFKVEVTAYTAIAYTYLVGLHEAPQL